MTRKNDGRMTPQKHRVAHAIFALTIGLALGVLLLAAIVVLAY